MYSVLITSLQTLNQLLSAGIAITAFSLLFYALTFNLRDRVARSFAIILLCVVVVFVADAIGSVTSTAQDLELWLRLQWVGIVFLPAAYLHFSDALLSTTGRPSRGRRSVAVRLVYLISGIFLATLPFSLLVGPLVMETSPAPHLERTWLSWIFTLFYVVVMLLTGINLIRAYRRTVTSTSRRRMGYLLIGALAPALGSYPYLLFGSTIATRQPLLFWVTVSVSNLLVSVLLVTMAYAVAFFGVSWPDRIVKRRLFKWLMRGPVTASTVLAITTLIRRAGQTWGFNYQTVVPIIMVGSVLILEHLITLVSPVWERWLFHGGDRGEIELMQNLEERLLTSGDMQQFLESVLAAVCDRLRAPVAFIAALGNQGLDTVVTAGDRRLLDEMDFSDSLLEEVAQNDINGDVFLWGDYWLVPLYSQDESQEVLLGLLGIARQPEQDIDEEQGEALSILAQRAALALEDRRTQEQVFSSLKALSPEVDLIQRLRAAARYDGTEVLTTSDAPIEQETLSKWVKDALSHYWGGPKLTKSPLMKLSVVEQAVEEHEGNPTNALRAILRQAIESVRPEGERRFTGEWILYNILELKFMEGYKVRDVAMRLAVSEADLYRKQRVAIEAVANAIIDMEQQAIQTESLAVEVDSPNGNSS